MTSPVKTIREHLLLTQDEFAKKIGVSRPMVWAYETGKSVPRLQIIRQLIAIAKENDIEINAADFFIE